MTINKYGLSRRIEESVKRQIRQRCGFGCVNCGQAIYQYEHVEPLFAEAKLHDPENIVLLCGSCHDRVTRGLLSKETIKLKSKNPKCLEQGFSFGPFDLGNIEPEIEFGTLKCKGVKTLIRIMGEDVLSVTPPDAEGLPFQISAKLTDIDGTPVFEIINNEWLTPTTNWDVEVVGKKLTIRRGLGEIVLALRSEPPRKLVIERVDMFHKGIKISARENEHIQVTTKSGQQLKSKATEIVGSQIGIDISDSGFSVGVGGGSVYIEHLEFRSDTVRTPEYIPDYRGRPPFKIKPLCIALRRAIYNRNAD